MLNSLSKRSSRLLQRKEKRELKERALLSGQDPFGRFTTAPGGGGNGKRTMFLRRSRGLKGERNGYPYSYETGIDDGKEACFEDLEFGKRSRTGCTGEKVQGRGRSGRVG